VKRFYWFGKYPYNSYGNAIALTHHICDSWIEANLKSEDVWDRSGMTGELYLKGNFVRYQTAGNPDSEGGLLYSFNLRENKQKIIDLKPEWVVDSDPLDLFEEQKMQLGPISSFFANLGL
jgi:hypothetical protein